MAVLACQELHACPSSAQVTGALRPARAAYLYETFLDIYQRKTHGPQGSPEVAAVLPPFTAEDAHRQLQHARASLLQQAAHKTQKRQARRAAGRV